MTTRRVARWGVLTAVLAAAAAGCKSKQQPVAQATPPPTTVPPTTTTLPPPTTMATPPPVWRAARWGMTRKDLLAAFPDFHVTVEDVMAEGDVVSGRLRLRGTHTGPFQGIPPTGAPIDVLALEWGRRCGGTIGPSPGRPSL